MRKKIVITWLTILFMGIIALFWHFEWVYSLPTPVPNQYRIVKTGEYIAASQNLSMAKKPLFLHFYNPDCPCSRFNLTHFKTLVQKYHNDISFAIVPMTNKHLTATDIQEATGLQIPVLFDTTLAAACGVYSTPQAVIIDTNHTLYYRGNYNKARYCTAANSNYAEIALNNLLHHQPAMIYDKLALQAYGCQLPNCTK